MTDQPKLQARPVFRWLAALTCPVFLLAAVWSAFPGLLHLNDPPSIGMMLLFLWGGFYFALVAATGRGTGFNRGQLLQVVELHKAAQQYVAGQMTLEEYGSRTKELLETAGP